MRKSIILRAAVGFVLGMAMFLVICLLFNRGADDTVYYCTDTLLSRVGSGTASMLLSLLACGLFGAACMAGTVFYEIEHWPLAKATAVHYAVVALGYLLPALGLGWDLTPRMLLVIEGMMTAGFFLIWLIMYLRFKAQVRELNELNRKKHDQSAERK